jgi:cob(I)alamin adenosyltransferase
MKIYTKTGDDGSTGLFGGGRVSKSHLRVEAYGTIDELNAILGLARSANPQDAQMEEILTDLQETLFVLGADLATPQGKGGPNALRLEHTASQGLEATIDTCEEQLEPLKNFVLPGGCPQASQLHLARTVCRRGERQVVSLLESEIPINNEILVYLNRLSDLLFVLGRWANHRADQPETLWWPRS